MLCNINFYCRRGMNARRIWLSTDAVSTKKAKISTFTVNNPSSPNPHDKVEETILTVDIRQNPGHCELRYKRKRCKRSQKMEDGEPTVGTGKCNDGHKWIIPANMPPYHLDPSASLSPRIRRICVSYRGCYKNPNHTAKHDCDEAQCSGWRNSRKVNVERITVKAVAAKCTGCDWKGRIPCRDSCPKCAAPDLVVEEDMKCIPIGCQCRHRKIVGLPCSKCRGRIARW